MSEDSIRNVNISQPETIHKLEHATDKPMKREKRKKGYNPKREKDSVEIQSKIQVEPEPHEIEDDEEENVKDTDEVSINILVE